MENMILTRALELEPETVHLRRMLHRHPEIGFQLDRTVTLVMDTLKEYGYQPKRIGRAGVTATVGAGSNTFLLRADMDALPIKEQTGLAYASDNDFMHACGHDFHTSALLTAAKILKEQEGRLAGTVKLMFQPCEEGMEGAADMVAAGILQDPVPDAALALHVYHADSRQVGYSPGMACASSDIFTIRVTGKGGHGAAPHLVIDPIHAAAQIQLALQILNSREVHPDQMLVCSICQVHAGTAANIFPDHAWMQGTIRTMDDEVRAFAKRRLVEIVQGTAAALRAEATVEFLCEGAPPMRNNDQLLNDTIGIIDSLLGENTCREIPRMTGSEDFSVVSSVVPAVLLWVGTGSEEQGFPYGVHDARVTFDESVLHKMSAIYVETAMRWLERI